MTHIVAGGAGFIGSHLVDALAARDEKVRVVDNFIRGSMENLRGPMRSGHAQISTHNLESTGIPMLPDDVVWHLAAKVTNIEQNRKSHYEMMRANMAINYNVIESVRKQKPKLFVFASTACVYPHDAPVPTPESAGDICNPEETNHGYGVAKWVGEQMVRHLYMEHNVPCVIVRFFNVLGERDYYDASSHVAPALIRRVMEGENPVKVWGSGKQTRTLVDAKDIARALIRLYWKLTTLETIYEGKYEGYPSRPWIVNIGHEHEVSIAELIETIVRLSGKDVGYEFDTSKPDGHARRAADTTLLRRLIGWVPNTPLEETLAAMIQEWREGRSHT